LPPYFAPISFSPLAKNLLDSVIEFAGKMRNDVWQLDEGGKSDFLFWASHSYRSFCTLEASFGFDSLENRETALRFEI